jgi:hypothetical protein
LKEISELAIAVGQEVGFMLDTSNAGKDKDSLSVNAKAALEDFEISSLLEKIFLKQVRWCLTFVGLYIIKRLCSYSE